MVSISIHFTPLLDAMTACAAMTLSTESDRYREFAIQSYCSAIRGVRSGLAGDSFMGTEDYLLAVAMWLCIFEVGSVT